MDGKPSETWCYETLRRVRWPRGVTCPFCGHGRTTTHSKSDVSPRRRYLCLRCRHTFTDLTGTPLARTNLPLVKWFACLRLFDRRYTISELARELDVKWDTTVHMQRRLALALSRPGLARQLRATIREPEHSSGRVAPRMAVP